MTTQKKCTRKLFEDKYINKNVLYSAEEVLQLIKTKKCTVKGKFSSIKKPNVLEGIVLKVPNSKSKSFFEILLNDINKRLEKVSEDVVITGIENYNKSNMESSNMESNMESNTNEEEKQSNNEGNVVPIQNSTTTDCFEENKSYDESIVSSGSDTSDNDNGNYEEEDHLCKEQKENVEEESIHTNALEENKITLEELPERSDVINSYIDPSYLESMKWDLNGKVDKDAEDIYKNQPRVKSNVLLNANSPIDVFLYFFPETLWSKITIMSNIYKEQKGIKGKDISCEDIMKYVGLLIARSMNPWSSGMRNHWRTRVEGIVFFLVEKVPYIYM